ncbi:N-acyl homoserine lactonase family protein [Halostagnicola kamekurae]|uniref:Glyoxylase, beta-lactamase superfamily II n=1 Tax=Halostagnicola kamekurae TaxID=619731 RepID=A0A1I6TCL1_9EURY|nr:N-acyl homoserine lactonase family protein [Halostagnicola kamekurae]SFS86932.1 Glyoxylase, beta-lactamase superfamily II [Halostagnicola kamekurae]
MVNATVSLVDRGTIRTDLNHLIEGYEMGSAAEPNPETPMDEGPVYGLVIDHPVGTILWDTGSHPQAGEGYWPDELYAAFEHYDAAERDLETALDDVGYTIGDIDYVFQTHLHLDHAGSLHHFAGTDIPVFVHEKELKYAYYSAKTDEGSSAYVLEDFDHDLNWHVIHRDRTTFFEDIEFIRLPGHTPGLMGTMIHLDDYGTAIFAGDEVYMRENYDNEVPLGAGLLWSQRHWHDSLTRLKELERRHDADVFCGHAPVDAERLTGGLP